MTPEAKPDHLGEDILWGAAAIAAELGVSVRKVYYLIETKHLPVKKLGHKTLTASRRELRELFKSQKAS